MYNIMAVRNVSGNQIEKRIFSLNLFIQSLPFHFDIICIIYSHLIQILSRKKFFGKFVNNSRISQGYIY